MAAASQWPPELKKFVNDTFQQCTDITRPKVEEELKKVIFEAYEKDALWTTDWPNVKLQSLMPAEKKRKLSAMTQAQKQQEVNKRAKRAERFAPHLEDPVPGGTLASRLAGTSIGSRFSFDSSNDDTIVDWDKQTIVGRSTTLEKPYLRLTCAPDPNLVRPLSILKEAFDMVKRKWREANGENYPWVCDQFKSIRQDLVVQRIKNDFTVSVYEWHARIALEKGDLGEFNQCQTMLRDLYKLGLGTTASRFEFLGYRILYFLFSRNSTEISNLIPTLTDEQRKYEGVKHALAVRSALATSNYVAFFKLFDNAPKMGVYLMDHMMERERVSALVVISKSYRSIPMTYLARISGCSSPEELHEFLVAQNAAIYVKAAATDPPLKIEERSLNCLEARAPLVAKLKSLSKIDIKGQI